MIFDGAAEFEGTSLNDHLLRGSNYFVSLLAVLLHFRSKPVPLSADIEKMYHQVLVPEEDREATIDEQDESQRFWSRIFTVDVHICIESSRRR